MCRNLAGGMFFKVAKKQISNSSDSPSREDRIASLCGFARQIMVWHKRNDYLC